MESDAAIIAAFIAKKDNSDRGDGDGVWRTINERHVFIRNGQSPTQAVEQSLKQEKGGTKGGGDFKSLQQSAWDAGKKAKQSSQNAESKGDGKSHSDAALEHEKAYLAHKAAANAATNGQDKENHQFWSDSHFNDRSYHASLAIKQQTAKLPTQPTPETTVKQQTVDEKPVAGGKAGGYRKFSSIDDAKQYAEKTMASATMALPKSQQDMLGDYKNTGFIDVNNALRGKAGAKLENVMEFGDGKTKIGDEVREIDTAMKTSQIPGNITVFRGLYGNGFRFKPGAIYQDKGFVSTSMTTDLDILQDSPVIAEIRVPKGAHGIYIDPLCNRQYDEREILLDRNASFKVLSAKSEGKTKHVVMELMA